MLTTHTLGYPRIGAQRELKHACEQYWAGQISRDDLVACGTRLRQAHWHSQRDAGIDLIPCNDFTLYDHVLDMTLMLGAVPPRYAPLANSSALDLSFAMARGYQADGLDLIAMEMTKWFDTNYHYLVPEFHKGQSFTLTSLKAVEEFQEAQAFGVHAKPVLVGPVSYLLLGKEKEGDFHRLQLLDRLLPVYIDLVRKLKEAGATIVQIDEPFIAMDLNAQAQSAYATAFHHLKEAVPEIQILLATYFDGLRDNTSLAVHLPVDALHLDLVRAPDQLDTVLATAPDTLVLSLGVVDGRNIWKNDFSASLALITKAVGQLGADRVMIAPSCSLLHVPYDLILEKDSAELPIEVKPWLAFARQKLEEVKVLARLGAPDAGSQNEIVVRDNQAAVNSRKTSPLIHQVEIKTRIDTITPVDLQRTSSFTDRQPKQRHTLRLPLFPTTTIGSFPQTADIRKLRTQFRQGKISQVTYEAAIEQEIKHVIEWQEDVGLDVLVHGEAERNDMVQYFGELLGGCAVTQHGWVQSYGSRCVKPPIIYGDVTRKGPMTVRWSAYAQSLTEKPVKGMLTGPITVLQWSFVRDDQPRRDTAMQIALTLRDEVHDLEQAGVGIIQMDEPAFREGLPLRRADRATYLRWAVESFRLASSGVREETQIHTHMCYAEFNDIIDSIAAMDADAITLETSRSQMELLEAFKTFQYPNEIGPGVYDIHSPRIPACEEIIDLLKSALQIVSKERLWVNPDCGLKTRGWGETKAALTNMVAAARTLREEASAP